MNIFSERESDIRAYCRVYPVVFNKAKNARQTDINGKEYIDFFAGAGVLNFGHNNDAMKQAVIDYLNQDGVLHSLDMHTLAKKEFIETFVENILKPRQMPHKLQFMGPTGTNAVEAALKIARRATGRETVVAFNQGFHGMTLGALSCTANPFFRHAAGVPLQHVKHYPFCCEETGAESNKHSQLDSGIEMLEELEALYRDASSGVSPPAAFLIEVIQAEGGVNVADKKWLQRIEKLARDFNSLMIVDDIQVGVGRTGSFFSFDDLSISPDIICMAKGIGGIGTPLALNLVKPEIDQLWSPGEHTGTFRGQNLSFVAGKVALNYFADDTLMSMVKKNGQLMHEYIAPLQTGGVEIRGKGMILGLDIGDGKTAKNIVQQCFEKGLLIASCGADGQVIKLIPPLTISESDLREGLQILYSTTFDVLQEAA